VDITDPKSVRNTLANGLARLGEVTHQNWLIYNPFLYGLFHDMALVTAPKLAIALRETFPDAKRVVDVGCGTGVLAKELKDKGLTVVGCEYSPRARRYAARQGVEVYPFEIQSHLDQRLHEAPFDLATSTEVAEHLPESLADGFVDFMVAEAPLVVFTAAHPGQGGHGHINEQPQAYWIEKFEARGHAHDALTSGRLRERAIELGIDSWLYDNLMVFRAAD
jgi:SAM-dependent methyltransferase